MKRNLVPILILLVLLAFPLYSYAEDTTPPDTTIISGPSGEIDYRDVTFEWTGSDNVTATSDLIYSYKLEGKDDSWSNWSYDMSTSYSDLRNGDYTFKVKARDEAGNIDSSPATRIFNIEIIKPGIKKWSFGVEDYIRSSPAIGSNGTIYVGSDDGNLYAINPDGTEKWSFEARDNLDSDPAIYSNGNIYVGSDDGNLYAIYGESGGLANTAWPMFQHDLRHTGNVSGINMQPVAKFTFSPSEPNPEQMVTFDASSSSDSDGNIAQYQWDWDDDATYEDSLSSPTTEHSFSDPGDYPVTLKVLDNDDASDTTTKTVTIKEIAQTNLYSGWNLFSPPGIVQNPDPVTALSDEIDSPTLYYDYSPSDGYTIYPDDTEATQLTWKQGYWVQVSEDTPVDMAVDVPTQDYTLEFTDQGWSMIGVPYSIDWSEVAFSNPTHFQTDGAGNVRLVSWDPTNEVYLNHYSGDSYGLGSWRGYWVKVKEATSSEPAWLTVSKSPEPPPPPGSQTPLPQSVDRDELDYPPLPQELEDNLKPFAYPNPVTKKDQVTFAAQMAGVEKIKVMVTNTAGELVYDSGYESGNKLTWNLKNTSGHKVTNGIYLYRIQATGADGTIQSSKVKLLLVLQ